MSIKQKLPVFLSTLFAVISIDQWTKILTLQKFRLGESLPILPGYFDLTYVRNKGAAFGFLADSPAVFRDNFFLVVPIVALFVITVVLLRLPKEQKWPLFAFSLVYSGAIGNLIDRTRLGFVVDFLDFHYQEVYHWPAFNVADSAIVVGVSILFILSFLQDNSPKKA